MQLITNHDLYTFARECVLLLRPYPNWLSLRVDVSWSLPLFAQLISGYREKWA